MRLNGHTLRYDGISETGNAFYFGHTTFEGEGTLEMGSGWICTTNKTYSNIGRNLSLVQPSSSSGGLWLEAPFTVSNCVMRGGASVKGNGQLTVLGTFSPLADSTNNFPNVALANGSTLDLSDCSGNAFNIISKENRRVTFPDASDAVVFIDVGDRKLREGDQIISWAERPATLPRFKLADGQDCSLCVRDDGLYAKTGFTIVVR